MNEIVTASQKEPFHLRIIARMKHGILSDLADRLGGVKFLAAELGVSKETVSSWINFRCFPKVTHRKGGGQTLEKRRALVLKLCQLTGKRIDEIFPAYVADVFKEIEPVARIDRPLSHAAAEEMLSRLEAREKRLNLPHPVTSAIDSELREKLQKAMKSLSYREKEIVRLRYGLDDGYVYTLEETAAIFKVTKERIRQIEAKAIRKLQQPHRAGHLVSCCD